MDLSGYNTIELAGVVDLDAADALEESHAALLDENARLTAMVAELQGDRRMIVTHATMGSTDGEDLSINDICVKISAVRNEIYLAGKARAALAKEEPTS